MEQIETLTLQFNTRLQQYEIPLFRGAIISALTKNNILYHNHETDSLRYDYPLIQYKTIDKKATIVYIGKAVSTIADFMLANHFKIQIGKRAEELSIAEIKQKETNIEIIEDNIAYTVKNYLPFNDKNYTIYQRTDSVAEKVKLIEKILVGNILSFLKSQCIFVEHPIQVLVTDIRDIRWTKFKHISLICMDVDFKTNILLPNNIGIGKHVSIGYGNLNCKK